MKHTFTKLFSILFALAMLVGLLPVSSAFAAGPAPVRTEEVSSFNAIINPAIVEAADGEKFVTAKYDGVRISVVFEINDQCEPQLNTPTGPLTGAALDSMLMAFTKGAYTLPYKMDPGYCDALKKSGAESVQVAMRTNEVTLILNTKKVNTSYLDGLTEVGKTVEKSGLTVMPAGLMAQIEAGISVAQAFGIDEWDFAYLVGPNYRTPTAAPINLLPHREAKAIALSSLLPKPAASATPAPAGTKKAGYQIKSGDNPWSVATYLATKAYDFTTTYSYLQDFNKKTGWAVGQIVPLAENLKSQAPDFDLK